MYVDIPGSEGFLCSGMCKHWWQCVVAGEGKVLGDGVANNIYAMKNGVMQLALLCPVKSLWDFFQFYFSLKLEQPKWFFFPAELYLIQNNPAEPFDIQYLYWVQNTILFHPYPLWFYFGF